MKSALRQKKTADLISSEATGGRFHPSLRGFHFKFNLEKLLRLLSQVLFSVKSAEGGINPTALDEIATR